MASDGVPPPKASEVIGGLVVLLVVGLVLVGGIVWAASACISEDVAPATPPPTPTPTSVPIPQPTPVYVPTAEPQPTSVPTVQSPPTYVATPKLTPGPEAAKLFGLYQELLTFKDNPDFHVYCYSPEQSYYQWVQKIEDINYNLDLYRQTGLNGGDLFILGWEYCQNEGQETEKTREIAKRMNPDWFTVAPWSPLDVPTPIPIPMDVIGGCLASVDLKEMIALSDTEAIETIGPGLMQAILNTGNVILDLTGLLVLDAISNLAEDNNFENYEAMKEAFNVYIDTCNKLVQ